MITTVDASLLAVMIAIFSFFMGMWTMYEANKHKEQDLDVTMAQMAESERKK